MFNPFWPLWATYDQLYKHMTTFLSSFTFKNQQLHCIRDKIYEEPEIVIHLRGKSERSEIKDWLSEEGNRFLSPSNNWVWEICFAEVTLSETILEIYPWESWHRNLLSQGDSEKRSDEAREVTDCSDATDHVTHHHKQSKVSQKKPCNRINDFLK